jgi:hypothetical protein
MLLFVADSLIFSIRIGVPFIIHYSLFTIAITKQHLLSIFLKFSHHIEHITYSSPPAFEFSNILSPRTEPNQTILMDQKENLDRIASGRNRNVRCPPRIHKYKRLLLSASLLQCILVFSLWNLVADTSIKETTNTGYKPATTTTVVVPVRVVPQPLLEKRSEVSHNTKIHVSEEQEQLYASTTTTTTTATTTAILEAEYPRVYIVPIPSEFHRDLLNCSLALENNNGQNLKDAWHVKAEDNTRFQQMTNPKQPFGPISTVTLNTTTTTTSRSLEYRYTPMHPHFDGGEYDFDVYFHTMMEGYFRRVDSPETADLFYLPIYKNRNVCHPKGSEHFLSAVRRSLEWWMQKYSNSKPNSNNNNNNNNNAQKQPNFFTVSGAVCSCHADTSCHPARYYDDDTSMDLAKQIRVIAWERFSNLSDEKTGNLVVPYPTEIHELPNWSITETRPLLLLAVLGEKRQNCVVCGPCGDTWNAASTDQCIPKCVNIRSELIEQMRSRMHHKNDDDIALWTSVDNPSTKWFPTTSSSSSSSSSSNKDAKKNKFWPPKQATEKMTSTTFCLQPAGDTLSRKSFFESLQAGCIPVVFRNDDAYLEQLPFSNVIPYRQIYYYIPQSCVLDQLCFIVVETNNNNNNSTMIPTTSFVDVLRNVPLKTVHRSRELIQEYGRMWMYSSNDGTEGGYNDVHNPDAFLMALRETWRLSRD